MSVVTKWFTQLIIVIDKEIVIKNVLMGKIYQPLPYLFCAYTSVVLVLDRQKCYINQDARLAASW